MDTLLLADSRHSHRRCAAQLIVRLRRRLARHLGRRAARTWSGRRHRAAFASGAARAAAGLFDHAVRHYLRRAVWRFDDVDPGQYSRRSFLGDHLSRRLRDGASGARWAGARHRRFWLVYRRHPLDLGRSLFSACPGGIWPSLRTAGICRADAFRSHCAGLPGARTDGQGDLDGAVRHAARQRRPRSGHRTAALHL